MEDAGGAGTLGANCGRAHVDSGCEEEEGKAGVSFGSDRPALDPFDSEVELLWALGMWWGSAEAKGPQDDIRARYGFWLWS